MNDKTTTAIVSVLIGLVGVAIIAELVSKNSNTPNVLTSFGQTLQQIFCVALSPIMGGGCGGGSILSSVPPTSAGCKEKPCAAGSTWNSSSCACESVNSTIQF